MAKSVEEFEKLMESDRGERALYESAGPDDQIRLPITREGFEAFLFAAAKLYDIPLTDPLRNVGIGFVHHIENDTCETTLRVVGATLFKSLSNHCTWKIDQEIKERANAELRAEREAQQKAAEDLAKQQKIAAAQEKRTRKGAKTAKASDAVANEAAN